MAEFVAAVAAETEANWRQFLSYLFAGTAGVTTDGVLTGLAVTQTATASTGVLIALGAGVVQDTLLNGVKPLVSNAQKTLDILVANPMGATPRNDIVVFDAATASIRNVVGTPNASPTDPAIPATAIPLARLRNLASATTVPAAQIDDLRVTTTLAAAIPQTVIGTDTTWSPTITGLTSPTIAARYRRLGQWISYELEIKLAGAPSGNVAFTLPFPAQAPVTGVDPSIGDVHGKDVSAGVYSKGTAIWDTANSRCRIMLASSATNTNLTDMAATVPLAWASGDFVTVRGTYRTTAP